MDSDPDGSALILIGWIRIKEGKKTCRDLAIFDKKNMIFYSTTGSKISQFFAIKPPDQHLKLMRIFNIGFISSYSFLSSLKMNLKLLLFKKHSNSHFCYQESLAREQLLENKLITLQKLIQDTEVRNFIFYPID